MANYKFELKAQQWNEDPYYVASSMPVQKLDVVASTREQALEKARTQLGAPLRGRYWRFWVVSSKEVAADDDTKRARVAYLEHLTEEFNRIWPHGCIRSSEYSERESFDNARAKIDALTKKIEAELL